MADRKFTLQFDFEGNVGPIKAAVEDFKRSLKNVELPSNLSTTIEKTLSKLNSEMENFEALAKIGFNNLGDTSKAEKSFGKIITLLNQLEVQSKSITGLDSKKFLPQATINKVKELQKAWESVEKETSKKDELTKKIKAQTEAIEKQRAALKSLEEEREVLAAANKTKGARKGTLVTSQNADKKRRDEVVAEMTALEGEKGGKSSAKYTALKQELTLLGQAINKADREIDALSKDIADNQAKIKTYETNVSNTTDALQLLEKELADLKNSDITPKGLTELRQEIAKITKENIDQIPTDLKELQQVINSLADDELKEIAKSLNEIKQSAGNLPDSAHKGAESLQELVESGRNAAQAANEIENLKNQVLQFFSITNTIQLFKRTVQSAFDTVKELDAVMTETAVVTDFTVGDMWEKLPKYSKEASALGASIRDLYSATTLYYQQGLQTEAAMGVGIETMKMARIANMEAADATTAMTAALRGFNMEVNEMNAQRVNDVYSELAAITAADTSQIATAMSKTASIAASANMEFETTSALLAQIIETTQEAPETAGTAMKTIIARFTEVKELFNEGMLTGEDSEGEEININKIDAALKTVGISLKDFLNGSKGIDDIFLELASKWDDLDLATQRYIATTAAGSRQQSRFIAMMSNYERTMELVSAANNSAGASQEQFDKTLESIEAKLQKLKNAWDQFAMGLANNEILKGAVDVLTGLLNVVNKLTEGLSGGNGLAKSVISLITVIGALKGGGALFNKALGGIGQGFGIGQGKSLNKIKTGKKDRTITEKDSERQNRTQGEKDGKAYVSGWKRALEQGKKGGLKAGLKGFFGEETETEIEVPIKLNKEDYLAQVYDLNQENLNFDITEVAIAYDTGGIDAANEAISRMDGTIVKASSTAKAFDVDLQSVGIAIAGVGTACGLLASLFDNLGMEDAAGYARTLSGVFMGLGSAISILTNIVPGLGNVFQIAGGKIVIAGVASQLAWWWVFLIIGAIAALIVAITALSKAAYKNSLAGRMEAAAEATENAKKAAEDAKTAYDDLLNTKSTYSELQLTLENLTEGTREWKQALLEVNQEVLKLLETYPQLAKYISRGEDGQFIVTDEGWDKLEEQQYNQMVNTQAMYYGSKINELDLEQEAALRKLSSSVYDNFSREADGTYNVKTAEIARNDAINAYEDMPEIFSKVEQMSTEEFLNKDKEEQRKIWNNSNLGRQYGDYHSVANGYITIADINGNATSAYSVDQLIAQNGLQQFDEELYKLAASTGFTAEGLYNMRDSLAEYDSFMENYTQQIQAFAEGFMTGIDEKAAKSEYAGQVTSSIAKSFAQEGADLISNETQALKGNKDQEGEIKILAKELKEQGHIITDTNGTLKTYQEVYKALTGQEAGEKNIDELATEIAKIQVGQEYSDKAEDLIFSLDNLAAVNEKQAKMAGALISRDASDLNVAEMKELQTSDIYDYAGKLGYENLDQFAIGQGYQDKKITELNSADQLAAAESYLAQEGNKLGIDNVNDMLAYMKQNEVQITAGLQLQIDTEQFQADLEAQRTDIISGIDAIMGTGYTEKSDQLSTIAVQVLKNLSKQTSTMGEDDAENYIANFEEVLNTSNLTKKQDEDLSNYLSSVDWSNMTEAVEAMDYMQSLGIDSSVMQAYWDAATNGANTYISSMQEILGLTERLQKKMQNVGDIEKALAEGTATYDQMMEMVNAGVDISEFQLTPEGWKATAEQIETATDKLKQYNAEQAKAMADQQREAYQGALNNLKDGIVRKEDGTFTVNGHGLGADGLTSVDDSGKLVAGTVGQDSAARIASIIGETGYNSEVETYDQFVARIQEAYNSYIELLNNGEDLQVIADKQAAMAEAAKYTSIENEVQGGSEESIIYSAQNEATEAGLDPNEMMEYAAQLQNVHTELDNVTAAQAALANSKMNMGLGEIISSYDEWTSLIDESTGLIKASASEDVAAFNKLKDSVNKMLNTSEDLSDAFWKNEKNMKNLKKAAEGDTEALEDLQKAAASDYLQNLDLSGQVGDVEAAQSAIQNFANYLEEIDIPELEAGVKWDDSGAQQFINRFNDMASTSNLTAAQIQESVRAMGFDAEITYVEDTRMVPTEVTERVVDERDPKTGEATKWHTTTTNGAPVPVTGYFPVVKTLTSTGSGGGGVSVGNQDAGKDNVGGGGGGGGGGGSGSEKWENPYDEFYNTVQKLNEELRKRNKLEREYQKLLDDTNTNASDLVENSKKQLESLEEEKKTREGLLANRIKQMEDIESENSKYSEYARYNEELGVIEIDWEKIQELEGSTDEEFTKGLEEYISQLEDQEKLIEEEEDSLDNIEDEIKKIREQGKDEYFDFEDSIKEALVDSRQKEIDKLSAINDSINDTNTRLIDAMQSSIDQYRQDRENERTEEELSDKQRRLAYLQQDTSGANALEIMQLQKEIEEGQENYTDALIDQKISELQQQNDEAAEQRDRQIKLMEEQLQHYTDSGEIWKDVYELMDKGLDDDGIIPGSELEAILKESAGYEAMSNLGQMKWLEELENNVAEGLKWIRVGNSTKTLLDSGELKKGQKVTFKTADGKNVTGTLNEDGTVTSKDGKIYKDVYRNYDGTYKTTENYQEPDPPNPPEEGKVVEPEIPKLTEDVKRGVSAAIWNGGYGWGYDPERAKRLKEVFGENDIQDNYVENRVMSGYSGKLSDYSYENMKKKFKIQAGKTGTVSNIAAFKTGGLADFTGPAWLDGTKSKPEYILNADQTKAFFSLVDVLEGFSAGRGQSSQISGDSIYDVDINVESIGSDYDVEQLATTIKRMINDDARYRNNNAINLSR